MAKEFYDLRVRAITVLAITIILFFVIAPFQKLSVSMLEGYTDNPAMEKFMPKGFTERLKEWNFYINSQWYGKNFGQIIPIIGIIIAFPLFSREFENGTIAFLLVRRSRRDVFISKFLAGLLVTACVMFVGSSLPPLYSLIMSKNYDLDLYFKAMLQSVFAGVLWYNVGMFFSTIFRDQVKPILASLGILALTTTVGFLKGLRFLNTYPYALCSKVLESGTIDIPYTIGVVAVSIVLVVFSYGAFKNSEV
ncbi:MAG: ABC transporter permease subunit [Fervidobacterium sp.]